MKLMGGTYYQARKMSVAKVLRYMEFSRIEAMIKKQQKEPNA